MEVILLITGLIFSIVLHELAHGYVADRLGDLTPRLSGRLTFNPLPHIDFWGSVLLPFLTYITGGFILGWAKPVPINPFNLSNPKRDLPLIAIAGPLTNIFIALLLSFIYKIFLINGNIELTFLLFLIRVNLLLAIVNLLPIPPLDGSKLFLPNFDLETLIILERVGIFFAFIFIIISFPFIKLVVDFLYNLLI